MAMTIRDRVLVVESDTVQGDLISRQALQAAGYQTVLVTEASTAINKVIQLAPDAILVDLNMPGLSGKDLLVALSSQGIETPVIVMAARGLESDIMQAFRLGASDYVMLPAREAEVVRVVERALKQVRDRRERERLAKQLQQTNQELQLRVRELTTIFSIGKAVISVTDQSLLFDKILDGSTKVTQSDIGWFLLQDEKSKNYVLMAQRNLPPTVAERMNQPWDDNISSLVAMSGEPLSIYGEPLKRFKIAGLGQSALIVPIKVQKNVIGLLVVMRKSPTPFSMSDQHLVEAVADYASISLVNARLFKAVEERARNLQASVESAQAGEKINTGILMEVKEGLRSALDGALPSLDRISKDPTARWSADQRQVLSQLQDQLQVMSRLSEAICPIEVPLPVESSKMTSLNDLVHKSAEDFQHFARLNDLTISVDLSQEVLYTPADPKQVIAILNGLVSNAVQYSNVGGRVYIRLEKNKDNMAQVSVIDGGSGIDPRQASAIFSPEYKADPSKTRRFGGLGISLSLVKEITGSLKGKVWVESKPGQGSCFFLTLPVVNK